MKKIIVILSAALILAASAFAAAFLFVLTPANPPETDASGIVYGDISLSEPLYPSAPGTDVTENKYASVDYSNASQGYISVFYKGGWAGENPMMKITHGETAYTYVIGDGEDIFPLNCGDGEYVVKIYRSVGDGRYTTALTKKISVTLENQLLPYLYPSQIVSYDAASLAVEKADQMCAAVTDDLEKLRLIYDFVTQNIAYDYKKAANIQRGYLPSINATYISGTGICFDYSAIMAAMLRTQKIPVKLVMGYLSGTSIFHAWNEVYIRNSGWVTVKIPIDAKTFRLLDPTIASTKGDEEASKKLDDPEGYLPIYKY